MHDPVDPVVDDLEGGRIEEPEDRRGHGQGDTGAPQQLVEHRLGLAMLPGCQPADLLQLLQQLGWDAREAVELPQDHFMEGPDIQLLRLERVELAGQFGLVVVFVKQLAGVITPDFPVFRNQIAQGESLWRAVVAVWWTTSRTLLCHQCRRPGACRTGPRERGTGAK